MGELTVFTYTDQQVRTVVIDGEPWFVAADVCAVIGISKHRDAVSQLDEDERASTAVDTPGGRQTMTVVNEAGVYSLMLISRSPLVKPFKRWLTHEVVPTLRRGGQIAAMPLSQQLAIAAEAARRAEELEALRAIEAPKVEAFDAFMDADGTYTMDAAAKSLMDVSGGMGRNQLFAWLRDQHILMPGNRPYQSHAHWFKVVAGTYEDSNGLVHATYTTHVRPAGLDGIRRRLAERVGA